MLSTIPLIHVTDVGATQREGVDSLLRIKKQYARLGHAVDIIPAGHSPLHVAFVALTDLSYKAQDAARNVGALLHEGEKRSPLVIALNCAPRNNEKSVKDAQESYMYRLKMKEYTYILYGPAVFEWTIRFMPNNSEIECERLISIAPHIEDTSKGSQFRSAEYLPIAHVLESHQTLTDKVKTTPLELPERESFENMLKENNVVVLPPDEYHNTRVLFHVDVWREILANNKFVKINGLLLDEPIAVSQSLTEVTPDTISLWPSSNYLPNPNFAIINMGTRWKAGTTKTTHLQTQALAEIAANQVGTTHAVQFE